MKPLRTMCTLALVSSLGGCEMKPLPAIGDNFGYALASADFNSDGEADLAAGAPNDDTPTLSDTGVVNVLYGAP